jgi:HEPN domain-containing protein
MSSSSPRRKRIVARRFAEPLWSERSGRGGCWLTPEESEEVHRLLTAARSDLRAANALAADPDQANDVIGFHAQQAVEKAIKAVLVASGIEIPYTHDIAFLLDLAAHRADTMPDIVAQSDWLTPWAVAARYGAGDASLDRGASITVADAAIAWAAGIV